MISVDLVRLEDLTETEIVLLAKYCRNCPEPLPVEDLVNRVRRGLAGLYRYSGDADGIVVLAKGDGGLYVETIAGDVVKHFDEIYLKIKMVASGLGARRLYSYTTRPALERLFKRTRAKPVATLYREDLL